MQEALGDEVRSTDPRDALERSIREHPAKGTAWPPGLTEIERFKLSRRVGYPGKLPVPEEDFDGAVHELRSRTDRQARRQNRMTDAERERQAEWLAERTIDGVEFFTGLNADRYAIAAPMLTNGEIRGRRLEMTDGMAHLRSACRYDIDATIALLGAIFRDEEGE